MFSDLDYSYGFYCWSEFMVYSFVRYHTDLGLDLMVAAALQGVPVATVAPMYTEALIFREEMMDLEIYFTDNLIDFDYEWLVNALQLIGSAP